MSQLLTAIMFWDQRLGINIRRQHTTGSNIHGIVYSIDVCIFIPHFASPMRRLQLSIFGAWPYSVTHIHSSFHLDSSLHLTVQQHIKLADANTHHGPPCDIAIDTSGMQSRPKLASTTSIRCITNGAALAYHPTTHAHIHDPSQLCQLVAAPTGWRPIERPT
jgi:hypothetical protein